MNTKLISVIIPLYNGAKYIEETVLSVLGQTYSPIEVIVVNDGSTDNSNEVIAPYVSEKKITLIQQQNAGVSAARNNGFAHSKGDYVIFLDADDVFIPDTISLRVDALENNQQAAFAYSDVKVVDGNSQPTGEILYSYAGDDMIKKICNFSYPIKCPSNVLIKRNVMEQVGGFDTQLSTSADFDMWLRICSLFVPVKVEKMSLLYRKHGSNMSANVKLYKHDADIILAKYKNNSILTRKNFYTYKFNANFLLFKFLALDRKLSCVWPFQRAVFAWIKKSIY